MKRILTAGLALAVMVVLARWPVSTKQGLNYVVSTHQIPLYQKALQFVDRDIEMRGLARAAVDNNAPPAERALKLMQWTHDNVHPVPDDFPVVDDHPYNISIRGYGTADQADDLFSMLLAYSGVPATLEFAGRLPYAFATARIDGDWRVFDVREGHAFTNASGQLASIAELAADPEAGLAHGLRVRAAGHERHLVAGLLQPRAVVAAHAAASHHHDLHGRMLGSWPRPWQA